MSDLRPAHDRALRQAQGAAWHTRHTVRFAHCDPAGIVFYPRFFEIAHEAKEEWFRAIAGVPFQQFVGTRGRGLPIVRLEADFFAASRHGDELDIAITVAQLGRSSLHLHYAFACGGEPRLAIRTVIVQTDLRTGRPVPIDGELRERIEAFRAQPGALATGAQA
ncbi:acyl-CoA thioesterase [Betaproteobacteria bacterium PRO7]|nr:acyl-CoA thioesterase [Betaproteobacteria bacterium PRO7]GIL04335.1 MAG: 4-hydroxybenzoyl-CoA thioesterase [Betaproteobacteria bacterium]